MVIRTLDCHACPAHKLRDEKRIRRLERQREAVIRFLGQINLFLLCESPPSSRFIYDKDSDYPRGGLRPNLRMELVGNGTDADVFEYLRERGTLIADCGLCPLHKLKNKTKRRAAATVCLKRHTHAYLERYLTAPIITVFPNKCGFLKRKLPRIQERVISKYGFGNLEGLKAAIDALR